MKKIAVITGASSGMGREMVYELADRFRSIEEIWVIARREDRLLELRDKVTADIRTFALDITDKRDLEQLKKVLEKERPNVKFLVNAAGYGKIGRVGKVSLEEEAGMTALNCEALAAVTHVVLPFISDHSRIIQFASAAAFLPQPKFAVYAATKAFVLSYSRALNEELRQRDICVTAVCPGPVKTEFFDIAETTGKIPLYKKLAMAKPERVVKKAVSDSCMGKSISVYGFLMKLFFILSKVMPHKLLLSCMNMGKLQGEGRR
ncbi:SDR family NAD(P)-dependent oxidoreductase [Lachnospiraceae bacterium 62-35]